MGDAAWLKPNRGVNSLHHQPRSKGGDHRANPYRATQQPARQQHHRPQQYLHQPDGHPGQPLAQGHQQRIPGAAALARLHVHRHAQRHQRHAQQQAQQPHPQAVILRQWVQPIEHLDEIAGKQRVDHRSKADFFPQ